MHIAIFFVDEPFDRPLVSQALSEPMRLATTATATLRFWDRISTEKGAGAVKAGRIKTFAAPVGGFSFGPVHPGEVLGEELEARGLSANALALKLRVPANRISEIINGKRGVSAETALSLARYLGTGAQFWMNLQAKYDLEIAERDVWRCDQERG